MAPRSKAGLIVVKGRDAGKVIPLTEFPFTIGRQPDNHLVLADEQVSRRHACIEKSGAGLILVDLKSQNGVFVDEKRVEKRELSPGDRIRFGSTVLQFHTDAPAAQQAMVQSIPDAESFALASDVFDEPTSVHFGDPEEAPPQAPDDTALSQAMKLFGSQLPLAGAAGSLLDVFFQAFSPDRAQCLWEGEPRISVARSRAEGRNTRAFDLPADALNRAQKGALALRTRMTFPGESKEAERWVLVAPLTVGNTLRGWLYGDRSLKQPEFTQAEVREFATFSALAAGILERIGILHENKILKGEIARMERHLSPEVARMLRKKPMSIDESEIGVTRKEVTILFCDIQGFTPLSERLKAEELAQLLNEYFERMVEVIHAHHGHLNKFIGDAIMALFGAPESHGNDAANAVAAGLAMVASLKEFWAQVSEHKRFHIRIGVNTGSVVAGNIGSEKKMEYTVLGDAVNVASRLEGISPPDTVTIGPMTAEKVKELFDLEGVPSVQVKGKTDSIKIFRVRGRR